MNDPSFSMLGIEDELKKDIHGTYANNIRDRLYRYMTQLKSAMDSGMTPDEFAAARQIYCAIQESLNMVNCHLEAVSRY